MPEAGEGPRPLAWVRSLLKWYGAQKRVLPWRDRPTPYAVWVSEIMLQQTQVATALPFYARFMSAFPSVEHLASADQGAVLKAWEGLGYYSRARNLHRAAREVVASRGGELPVDAAGWRTLPGVGPYTAAAIASICFDEPAPCVDGNVLRVFTRFWGIVDDVRRAKVRGEIEERLRPHIRGVCPGDFNQAAMELGALVCRPTGPRCPSCPLRRQCNALRTGRVGDIPFRSPRAPVPHYDVAAAVVRRNGRVLIARRRADQMLGGLWEFPGGKRERGERLMATVRRELMEETGLDIEVGPLLCRVKHAYSHFRITMRVYDCRAPRGTARAVTVDAVKWVPVSRLRDYAFSAADIHVIERLEGRE